MSMPCSVQPPSGAGFRLVHSEPSQWATSGAKMPVPGFSKPAAHTSSLATPSTDSNWGPPKAAFGTFTAVQSDPS